MRGLSLFLALLALGCFGIGFWAITHGRGVLLFTLMELMALALAWAAGALWDDRQQ